MPSETDDVWASTFHGCAWAAFIELAVATGGPPPAEHTRRLAYRMYEEELARAHAGRDKANQTVISLARKAKRTEAI